MHYFPYFSFFVVMATWSSISFGQDAPTNTEERPETPGQTFFAPVNDNVVNLLYGVQDDTQCKISLWDPNRNTANTLYTSDSKCTEYAFVSDSLETLFIVINATLHTIPFNDKTNRLSYALPIKEMQTHLARLKEKFLIQFHKAYNRVEDFDEIKARPVAAGYLKSGELALAINTIGPADDTHAYLYIMQSDGAWKMVNEKSCHRFESCAYGQINGRSVYDRNPERAIWHEHVKNNHFLSSKETQLEKGKEYDYLNATLQFKIDNQTSILTYTTINGPDTGAILTLGVALKLGDEKKVTLTNGQCEASIASHYLLLERFWGEPMELIGIGTGNSLFGPLAFATWVR